MNNRDLKFIENMHRQLQHVDLDLMKKIAPLQEAQERYQKAFPRSPLLELGTLSEKIQKVATLNNAALCKTHEMEKNIELVKLLNKFSEFNLKKYRGKVWRSGLTYPSR